MYKNDSTKKTGERLMFADSGNYWGKTPMLPYIVGEKKTESLPGLPRFNTQENKEQAKTSDPFLEGFNSTRAQEESETEKSYETVTPEKKFRYYGKRYPQKTETQLVANSEPDQFLAGFNYYSNEGNHWDWTGGSIKNAVSRTRETVKDKIVDGLNSTSVWANKVGILDNATNGFFKAYDNFWSIPGTDLSIDLVHHVLSNLNYKENQKVDLSEYQKNGGYINDQGKGMQSDKVKYGFGVLGDNGCEVIAVNNALCSLRDRKDIRDIAKEFETDGQTLFGMFGTSPYAVGEYFRKKGYEVDTYEGDNTIYNLDIPDADTYIMSFWNSDKVTSQIHTVSMDKLENGKYRIYNIGKSGVREEVSLNGFFREKNRVPLVLHCIKKRR